MNTSQHQTINSFLIENFSFLGGINNVIPVSGGCINETYCIQLATKKFFCKVNNRKAFPEMFEKERNGLLKLKQTNTVRVPEVIGVLHDEEYSYLLLEFIEERAVGSTGLHNLGVQIAKMHKVHDENFGWNEDNYIGSLKQINTLAKSWSEFYVQHRLSVQLKLAVDAGKLEFKLVGKFENLYQKLEEIFPKERPSLLHGDLWSGNFMIDTNGKGVLFDPSVYYGHREMDLGMTKLFGGFSPEFYYAYHQMYPLEKNWQQRIPLTQLYPLLVHVNLFGGGYGNQVRTIVEKY